MSICKSSTAVQNNLAAASAISSTCSVVVSCSSESGGSRVVVTVCMVAALSSLTMSRALAVVWALCSGVDRVTDCASSKVTLVDVEVLLSSESSLGWRSSDIAIGP